MFDQRPFKRTDRVSDKVRLAISEVLLKDIVVIDTGLITITRVVVSKDLRYAKVFFSHIQTKLNSSELEAKLNQNKSRIRYYMGNKLEAQYVPQINFIFDRKYEKSTKIDNLLNKIKKSDK